MHNLFTPLLRIPLVILMLIGVTSGCQPPKPQLDSVFEFAKANKEDLRLSVFITAHTVERLLGQKEGLREATSLMMANGITKVYLEVYRSGLVVKPALLAEVTDYFSQQGFEVVGGIATVPGREFGVRQEGPLGWFNWQNEKTQRELRKVMVDVAPIFDTFIVDDFLCTSDTSVESKSAKGAQEWSEYRRSLLTELATSIFIAPAKSVNPDIEMIIKYPQWYDRFHLFGYDVESGPRLFDKVWVGTETRGQYTQRFGFVQPYEGFINYRWISSLSGDKIGGAWFDHGDCDALDFIEQAYQTVLAGANEIVIFNYDSFVNGHPGHHHLRMDLEKLVKLAKAVKTSPVTGIPAYKPPHSDAGGDLYVMDFIGMLGIPIVPVSMYPTDAKTLFLPTQASSDTGIVKKVTRSIEGGTRIIMTAGFLAQVDDKGVLSKLAGVNKPTIDPFKTSQLLVEGNSIEPELPLELEARLSVSEAEALLSAVENKVLQPYLTENNNIYVLNSHTFSQADFDAVGEVLLSPRPLGILEVPDEWANVMRRIFNHQLPYEMQAPSRVTSQPLSNGDVIIHNYKKEPVEIQLSGFEYADIDGFTGKSLNMKGILKVEPRSRIWLFPK
ncbi:MAG: hypothetical protein RIC06_13165 [Cyclobacteriaceae bacterium]